MSNDHATLVHHARRELSLVNSAGEDGHWTALSECVLDLADLLEAHQLSPGARESAVALLNLLARGFPLTPLSGDDEEWEEVEGSLGVERNIRYRHLIRRGGEAVDLQARLFVEPCGTVYTSAASARRVTFPYAVEPEYVLVDATECSDLEEH